MTTSTTTKLYRCGYCGSPTDEHGTPLDFNDIDQSLDWNLAELTHGICCAYNFQPKYEQVTKEMAMDAGFPELEGTMVLWG